MNYLNVLNIKVWFDLRIFEKGNGSYISTIVIDWNFKSRDTVIKSKQTMAQIHFNKLRMGCNGVVRQRYAESPSKIDA